MEIYFVRHGRSSNNSLEENLRLHNKTQFYEAARTSDPTLTIEGIIQARKLSKILKPLSAAKVFTSPMLRAIQTADPISKSLNSPSEIWVDLHEFGGMYELNDQGDYEGTGGLTKEEIQKKFPGTIVSESFRGFNHGWWSNPRPETRAEVDARAQRVAERLMKYAKENSGKVKYLWLVTHGTFLSLVLSALLNFKVPKSIVIHHNNVGVSALLIEKSGLIRIKFLNRIIHNYAQLAEGEEEHYDIPLVLSVDHGLSYMDPTELGQTPHTKSKL